MNLHETNEWQKMLFSLDLQDTFNSPNFIRNINKKFSWCNGHLDDTKRKVRFDRSDINQNLARKGGPVELVVHIPYLSDHSTHLLNLTIGARSCSKPHLRFNHRILYSHRTKLLRT